MLLSKLQMNLIINQMKYGLIKEENFTINLDKDG